MQYCAKIVPKILGGQKPDVHTMGVRRPPYTPCAGADGQLETAERRCSNDDLFDDRCSAVFADVN